MASLMVDVRQTVRRCVAWRCRCISAQGRLRGCEVVAGALAPSHGPHRNQPSRI
jgi:hypothetical protein